MSTKKKIIIFLSVITIIVGLLILQRIIAFSGKQEYVRQYFQLHANAVKSIYIRYDRIDNKPVERSLKIEDEHVITTFLEIIKRSRSHEVGHITKRYTSDLAYCSIQMKDGRYLHFIIGRLKNHSGYISFIKEVANRLFYLGEVYNNGLAEYTFKDLYQY